MEGIAYEHRQKIIKEEERMRNLKAEAQQQLDARADQLRHSEAALGMREKAVAAREATAERKVREGGGGGQLTSCATRRRRWGCARRWWRHARRQQSARWGGGRGREGEHTGGGGSRGHSGAQGRAGGPTLPSLTLPPPHPPCGRWQRRWLRSHSTLMPHFDAPPSSPRCTRWLHSPLSDPS